VYAELLKEPVIHLFKQRLAETNLHFEWQESERQIFWDMFTLDQPGQLDNLNALRGKENFLTICNSPIGEVVADLYEAYRWEALIKSEFMMRNAADKKKITTAEQQFSRTSRNEQSAGGVKKLARLHE
jgi:hypothetical protein